MSAHDDWVRNDKGRVVRGLCCSDGGVFKPDERETRDSLAASPRSVNAAASTAPFCYAASTSTISAL